MNTIVIIGAGNIGTRHLQGMYGLKNKSKIYVYDLSENSIEQCKKVCMDCEVSRLHDIEYTTDLKQLPDSIDIAIVATSANVRRNVIEELVNYFAVKYFILEKVLFQKVEDYYFVEDLLRRNNIKAWVNCPRRIYPSYMEMKDRLKGVDSFEIDIYGNNWGMGCNTIHYVDMISYLADDKEISILDASFEDENIQSKRKGFYEINGVIEGSIGKCKKFRITSYPDSEKKVPLTICIHSLHKNYMIIEAKNELVEYSIDNDWNVVKSLFEVPYQSQIAYIPVEDILSSGNCQLPSYDRSMAEHLPIIENFIEKHFSKLDIGGNICPIT